MSFPLTDQRKGQIAVAVEHIYRTFLKKELEQYTDREQEQLQIMIGIVTLQLRRIYEDCGEPALEAIVRQVLTPKPSLETPSAPAPSS